MATGLLVLATACLAWLRIERRLLSEGRLASATITAHRKTHTSHGGTHRSIVYQFAQLNGVLVTGKSSAPRKMPPIGSQIWILYEPERPARSRPWPLSLVR